MTLFTYIYHWGGFAGRIEATNEEEGRQELAHLLHILPNELICFTQRPKTINNSFA